jgi:hypothetical protein
MNKAKREELRKAYQGYTDDPDVGGALVYAATRGKARSKVAAELGVDFMDGNMTVVRAPKADTFAAKRERPTDRDMRVMGYTDESYRYCQSCGLGDTSDDRNPRWKLCGECENCKGCGCAKDCNS